MYLPDVFVQSSLPWTCRYNSETLEVHYKEKNIAVLDMTVLQGSRIPLQAHSKIERKLKTIQDVGLAM